MDEIKFLSSVKTYFAVNLVVTIREMKAWTLLTRNFLKTGNLNFLGLLRD